MVFEPTIDAERRQVSMLQEIIRAKHQRRRPGQLIGAHALGEMPGNEGRTGQRAVAHRPQQHTAGARHRPLAGTEACSHFTCTHAFKAHGLVFDHQIHQQMLFCAKIPHGLRPPGGQAVGIQGDTQAFGQAFFVQRRHQRLQITLKQTHLLHMVEQTPANFRGSRRCAPDQHRLADPRLKQFDALRDRRLRQTQDLGGTLEPGLLDHSGEGRQQFIVEHQFS